MSARALISLEYLRVSVVDKLGADLSAGVDVELALVLNDEHEPVDAEFKPAEWEGGAGPSQVARILDGPGGAFPSIVTGSYMIWCRFTIGLQRPAFRCGWHLVGITP